MPSALSADFTTTRQLEVAKREYPQVRATLIELYERMLSSLPPEGYAAFRALVLNDLGVAYQELTTGDRATNLNRAISCFRDALRFIDREAAPQDYSMIKNNLGNAYQGLPAGDRDANMAHAITCFREALSGGYQPTSAPREYAITQNNLGAAYLELSKGERTTNLKRAISCFQESLRFRSPEDDPVAYASTLNNLGIAYQGLPTEDRATHLRRAIACFREALRFRTPEATPLEYASTQNNLGNAYLLLPTGDRDANLQEAVSCFQQALRIYTPAGSPWEYAATKNNLGIAYGELLTGDREVNLAQAITCFEEALLVYTAERTPLEYAAAQNGLGNLYQELSSGDRVANLTQAVNCFREALRFYTPLTTPLDYAMTQNNLGAAYAELPAFDRAAECFQEALRFYTEEVAPYECRQTNSNLGQLHFQQQDWAAAEDAYRAAMAAGERLYRAGLAAESRAYEVAENVVLHSHAAFAAARLGNPTRALLTLERGKTRQLAEALRLHVSRPPGVPDDVWTAYREAAAAVRALQAGDHSSDTASDHVDPVAAYAAQAETARSSNATLESTVARVQEYSPAFLRPVDLRRLRTLLPNAASALVAFCLTDAGSIGFILPPGPDSAVIAVDVPGFTRLDLTHLLVQGNSGDTSDSSWLEAYQKYQEEPTNTNLATWQVTMDHTLARLGDLLLNPILANLPAGIERLLLLPSSSLFLLPLHAAPLPAAGGRVVGEVYEVRYAPSAEVLADLQDGFFARDSSITTPPGLLAVINPTQDPRLAFAAAEGVALTRFFAATVCAGADGTKQNVYTRARGRRYLHFSCHGDYDWSDPPQSGLALTDGPLTLAELQRGALDLRETRLVTLSACETGLTDVAKGSTDEYVGVPAGFLLAGVPCVVSSLWGVPDFSTALLMEHFYQEHVQRGQSIPAALRAAQQWVRSLDVTTVAVFAERCYTQAVERDKPELFIVMRQYRRQAERDPARLPFSHPYYWAGFTVNGI